MDSIDLEIENSHHHFKKGKTTGHSEEAILGNESSGSFNRGGIFTEDLEWVVRGHRLDGYSVKNPTTNCSSISKEEHEEKCKKV